MTKGKAITKFCIIILLTGLSLVLCFASFTLPFTTTQYNGFYGAIKKRLGIDLAGGVMAVFNTESKTGGAVTETEVNATIKRLENAFQSQSINEANIVRQTDTSGRFQIRVEVPGLDTTDEIFDAIGEPAELTFRDEKKETKVFAHHIKSAAVYQNPQTLEWGVTLTFTNDGGKAFRELVKNNDTTYIYLGVSEEPFSTVTVSDKNAGSNNTTVITLGKRVDGSLPTRADAEKFKLQIESGLYSVKLTVAELSVIDGTLGPGALKSGIIALLIAIVFIFIFMYLLYGDFGLLSNLALTIFMVIFLAALAVFPGIQLTLPGIAGIVLSLAMAVDANIIIFERIKDEYRRGKRLSVAVESGFNRSIVTIFDANLTTIIGGVVLYFLGTGPIKGFAITLLLGVVISMFCSLVITRSFAKLYLYINKSNAKRLRIKTTDAIKEIDGPKPTAQKPRNRKLNLGGTKNV